MSDVKQRVIAIVTGKEFVPKELVQLESDEVVVKRAVGGNLPAEVLFGDFPEGKELSVLGGILPAGVAYGDSSDTQETFYLATGKITPHPILSVKSVKMDDVDITENVEIAQGGYAGLCPEWKEFVANNRTAAPEPNNDATGVSVDQAEPKKPFIRFEMAWHNGGDIYPRGKCELSQFYLATGLESLPSVLPR
jgi:hypothetical protein